MINDLQREVEQLDYGKSLSFRIFVQKSLQFILQH